MSYTSPLPRKPRVRISDLIKTTGRVEYFELYHQPSISRSSSIASIASEKGASVEYEEDLVVATCNKDVESPEDVIGLMIEQIPDDQDWEGVVHFKGIRDEKFLLSMNSSTLNVQSDSDCLDF